MISYADRVLQTTQTTGTGTYSLDGTVPAGFQSAVAGIGGGSKGTFHIDNGVDWETIVGTLTDAATDTVSRDRILASSNGGAAVNWGAGAKNIRLILPSRLVVSRDENGNLVEAFGTAGGSANAQTLTFSPVPYGYSDGEEVSFYSFGNVTGALTVNKNALGAKTVKWRGADLTAGAFNTGDLIVARYRSATGFYELLTPPRTALISQSAFADTILNGLKLSTNVTDAANDIDIAAGSAVSDDGTTLMTLTAMTKRLDAGWSVGTGNGGLDTGSVANTTYHIWLINRPDTNVTDVLFSTSATSPTMPANYTKKKRIGMVVRASATNARPTPIDLFVSAEQTITAGGSLSLPHNLGVTPEFVRGHLICKTAEGGWAVGERYEISFSITDLASNGGCASWSDATNVNFQFGLKANVFDIIRRSATAGQTFSITPANWRLVLKARP